MVFDFVVSLASIFDRLDILFLSAQNTICLIFSFSSLLQIFFVNDHMPHFFVCSTCAIENSTNEKLGCSFGVLLQAFEECLQKWQSLHDHQNRNCCVLSVEQNSRLRLHICTMYTLLIKLSFIWPKVWIFPFSISIKMRYFN